MEGRWSRGWEEYEPCGIGLTSHSLPSAAQDMWGWTFHTPLILFLWVGRPQHTITLLQTEERGWGGTEVESKKKKKRGGQLENCIQTEKEDRGKVVRSRGVEEEGQYKTGESRSEAVCWWEESTLTRKQGGHSQASSGQDSHHTVHTASGPTVTQTEQQCPLCPERKSTTLHSVSLDTRCR